MSYKETLRNLPLYSITFLKMEVIPFFSDGLVQVANQILKVPANFNS